MYKSVLVAVDDTEHARKALHIATDLARLHDAKLTVLHVVTATQVSNELRHMAEVEHLVETTRSLPPGSDNAPANLAYALNDGALHERISRIATALGQRTVDAGADTARDSGVEVKTVLRHGDPAREILDYAERENIDVLVIGSRGRSNIEGMVLGSVSAKVNHAANCTCVTVR